MTRNSVLIETYLEHRLELLKFLGQRLGSSSLAADLAQDLYLKLQSDKEFPPVRDRRAYLFTTAANLATDHLRVEKRRGEILQQAQATVWPQANELTPEHHAAVGDEINHLAAAIAKLGPRCRRIFYLSRYEEKTQAQIAAELGVGITTVYKDLKTVMETLVAVRRQFHGPAADETDGRGPAPD